MAAYPPPPPQQGYGAPPPQQGYGAPPPQAGYGAPPRVVAAAAPMRFGENPCGMTCPYCDSQIVTSRVYTTGSMTWLVCFLIVGIGCLFALPCFLGCCLIPCCVNACKDVVHSCPRCNREVGKYNRL